jgi:hypothetical protein
MRYFFVFFLLAFVLHSAPSLAQTDLPRPSIRITGIDNDGKEMPFDTMVVSVSRTYTVLYFPKRIVADIDEKTMQTRYRTLSPQAVAEFQPNRCYNVQMCHVDILGYRLRQNPALTLVLEASQSERVKTNADIVRNYLVGVWGIAPERVSVRTSTRKDGFIMLQGTPALFEPLAVIDTVERCVPPIVRFYTTLTTEAIPQQWSITIKQRGKNLRVPISAAGKPRPQVDWKVMKENNATKLLTNDSVRCDFEIRYADASIPNQRSAPVYFFVKKTMPKGQDTALVATRCVAEFDDNASVLSSEGLSAVRLFKQQLRLQGAERLVCTMYSENTSDARFQAVCKKRVQELAKQLGIPESRLEQRTTSVGDRISHTTLVELSR